MAEEEGFEPPELLQAQRFSRPPHSTALPLLRSNWDICYTPRMIASAVMKLPAFDRFIG